MKALPIILLAFLLFATSAFAFTGKVVHIADGDTVTVLASGNRQVKIRLYGIDCPEKKQPYGQRARQAITSLIAGKTVDVEDTGPDRYGRTVGVIECEGININRQMVQNGMAWVYRRYCKKPECRQWLLDEADARKERRGLWQDSNAVPPWEWRRARKR